MQRKLQYISFDVYDTLVHRLIKPEDLYIEMGKTLHEKGLMEDFATCRIKAEQQVKNAGKDTYTLKDIYATAFFERVSVSCRKQIMEFEKQMELENALADENVRRIYQKYGAKYPIVCISDMYFDEMFIKELLCRNGYHPNKIYVSSELHCSKRNRKLYSYVAKDLGVLPKEILHLGDSPRNDWLNARLAGCKAKWIPNRQTKEPADHYAYHIGFQLFGPMMYEFCRWIHQYDQDDSRLLFLSREGEFIKQCYDLIYPENNSVIVYLSRQAILQSMAFMMLKKCTIEEFRKGIYVRNKESIAVVLRRIGLDVKRYKEALVSCGLSMDDRYDERIESFFQSNKEALLLELEEKSSQTAIDYLNCCLTQGKIMIDIGWRGSMQKLLQKFLRLQNRDETLTGLYLGIDDDDHKAGFLYQDTGRNRQNIRCFSGLLEIIMMPDHGTTLGYQEDPSNGITPIFGPNEFSQESYQTIAEVQKGIKNFIRQCTAMHLSQYDKRDNIIRKLIRFGCHPPRKAMKLFGTLEFFENGQIYRLIENTSLRHPGRMYDSFLQTRWKTAFLKSVFKLDLPYNWIISYFREAAHS